MPTYTDDFGRTIQIDSPPKRIVSQSPSLTEILFALKMGDSVMGVDNFSDYPPEVLERVRGGRIKLTGSLSQPDYDTIDSLAPDLILGYQKAFVEKLEMKGYKVLAMYPTSFDGILRGIQLVGEVCGVKYRGDEIVSGLAKRANIIAERISGLQDRPRVYWEVWPDPLMSPGRGMFINDLILMAGGVNIFQERQERVAQISSEDVVKFAPEIMVLPGGKPGTPTTTLEDLKRRVDWDKIPAVIHGRVYRIDPDLVDKTGPRILDGLEELARLLHPTILDQ